MNWFLKLSLVVPFAIGAPSLAGAANPWCRGKIDEFVQARHLEANTQPADEAYRRTLIRRLSLDLLGLPPTPDEVETFLADANPDAYEQVVERLLASPRFGERMAQFWLDLARYADSDGYHDDTNRSMWQYRDWVIDSFNKNKPFDEFTIEQLAGDLLPNASLEQQVATAFLRNGPTSSEDGANPDEYRARYAVDRVNTTSTIWLGLTIQCAECHDHKYDPITTREYYQLFAFFNQTPERPLFRGLYAPPAIPVPSKKDAEKVEALTGRIVRHEQLLRASRLQALRKEWESELLNSSPLPNAPTAVVCELLFSGDGPQQLTNTGTRRRAARFRPSPVGVFPESTAGLIDEAMQFSGRGEAIDLGSLFDFRRSFGFTVEAWLKFDVLGGPLISKIDTAASSRGVDVSVLDGRVSVRLISPMARRSHQGVNPFEIPVESLVAFIGHLRRVIGCRRHSRFFQWRAARPCGGSAI